MTDKKPPTTFNDYPVEVLARVQGLVAIEVVDHTSFGTETRQIIWVKPTWLKNLPSVKEYDNDSTVIFDGTAK